MNKKGFTLIELLCVVTLIVLISLIVMPNILSSINKKKGEISSANMRLLASAADVYIENHPDMYDNSFSADGSTYCIPLQNMIIDGLLETPFKDVNGNEVNYTDVVKATYNAQYNEFQYDFVKKNTCTEVIQYISRPVLADNMIPVVYDDGTWKKADVKSKWYNYSEKKWANAVLVREWKGAENGSKSRYDYLEAVAGTPILESDVLAYFVWIPRFRYKVFGSVDPISIDIVFEGVGTKKSSDTHVGRWLTHPAFTYNNNELAGIWVGKYETSNVNNDIIVKSGLTPWTNIAYDDVFNLSNSMSNESNIYGLRNFSSHMIKNSEWSAVTYLTQSIYGLNDIINVNSSSITGGTNSTTGNVYGIYDMAGLSSEFVTVGDENENSIGYSLIETSSWYYDFNSFIDSTNIYLLRGEESIFNYMSTDTFANNISFRVALVDIGY